MILAHNHPHENLGASFCCQQLFDPSENVSQRSEAMIGNSTTNSLALNLEASLVWLQRSYRGQSHNMDLDFCVEIALWTKNEKKYYDDECSATNFDRDEKVRLYFL